MKAMTGNSRAGYQAERSRRDANSGVLRSLEWCLLVAIGVSALGGHVLLAVWWELRGVKSDGTDHERNTHVLGRATLKLKPTAGVTPHLGETRPDDFPALSTVQKDDVTNAVDEILASRGDEPRIRRPLLAKPVVGGDCGGTLPALSPIHRSDSDVDAHLSLIFQNASGFWAADQEEVKHIAKSVETAGGPPAPCSEATYGEIQVEGLRRVLTALSRLGTSAVGTPGPFRAFVDLGAGVGRTAAAALILGFANYAFGVELGPERFAMGCQAIANASNAVAASAASQSHPHKMGPRIDLLHGDIRDWPLVTLGKWPACGPQWAVFIGAQCFRDTLLADVGRATARACMPGARVAVLGRRFPAEVTSPTSTQSVRGASTNGTDGSGMRKDSKSRYLEESGSLRAATTWSKGVEVFLYRVTEK